jgi:hypothetical protein
MNNKNGNDDNFINNGEWGEYKKLFINEMERSAKWQEKVDESLTEIKVEIAMLKVKSAVWGAIAAIVLSVLLNFGAMTFQSNAANVLQKQQIENLKLQMKNNKGSE